MEQRSGSSGLDLVLDNRKLILSFGVLILLCGAFFLIGFIEGKRQGTAVGERFAVANSAQEAPLPAGVVKKAPDPPVGEQLDWYRSVNKAPASDVPTPAAVKVETPQPPAAPPKPKVTEPKEADVASTFSVQVGAFQQRREAENKAASLKAKGYTYFIDLPSASNELFLLKVGKFGSRTAAAAMQTRLKKDGFSCFIKAN
jgi:cell division septation protein DedD